MLLWVKFPSFLLTGAVTSGDEATADNDDYEPLSETGSVINFNQDVATAEFTINIKNDNDREGDESFYVDLTIPYNGVVIEPMKARVIIEANDGGRGKYS